MGSDSVDRGQAWRLFDQLFSDERVLWVDEPEGLDAGLAGYLGARRPWLAARVVTILRSHSSAAARRWMAESWARGWCRCTNSC